ncbi:MAG: hypothetical protein PHQ89_03065 [Bacilli bacterium]|nr:hypothetical protein [Bacilli bacterium]
MEIIEFDNFDTIVIDSKKNDTKYAFHNSYCDVCIEENNVKEHFDLQKIQNGSQGNDDIKKLTNSFSVLDDKYNGILKYVQQACPNVSNSISTIMNEEVKSSIKK